jgi:L-ascorbate metabolism protein UlaG (beta-lactamase superfamily)
MERAEEGRQVMAMTVFMKTALFISVAGVFLFVASQCSKSAVRRSADGNSLRTLKVSRNYDGKKFYNTEYTVVTRPGTFWKNMANFFRGDEIRRPPFALKKFTVNSSALHDSGAEHLCVTWMGHSTVLIEIDGKRFLTDPVWSERVSPIPFMGPKRFFDPPCALSELPPLDGVIISHDHYDHLDSDTVRWFASRGVDFYAPLGVGRYLLEWGVAPEKIHELDWWEDIVLGQHRLAATPARHFSGRKFINGNDTLWASWVIAGPGHRVFYGGDGGMFSGFHEIGSKLGPFDVTMLEIGAYHENWSEIHLGPRGALEAHASLRGKILMPIHWGTFTLAFHDWDGPVRELIRGADDDDIKLLVPEPGRSIVPGNDPVIQRWWEEGAH